MEKKIQIWRQSLKKKTKNQNINKKNIIYYKKLTLLNNIIFEWQINLNLKSKSNQLRSKPISIKGKKNVAKNSTINLPIFFY